METVKNLSNLWLLELNQTKAVIGEQLVYTFMVKVRAVKMPTNNLRHFMRHIFAGFSSAGNFGTAGEGPELGNKAFLVSDVETVECDVENDASHETEAPAPSYR